MNLTEQLLFDLYTQNYTITGSNGEPLPVSPAGSMSLLATGYKGTILLRKVRGWKFKDGKIIIPPLEQEKSEKQ